MDVLSRAVAEALFWKMAYNDSNPDVGMGPLLESVLEDILQECEIQPFQVDEKGILAHVRELRDR